MEISAEDKAKVLKEYFHDRAVKAGNALKAQRGIGYYSQIRKKRGKKRSANLKPKAVDNSDLTAKL